MEIIVRIDKSRLDSLNDIWETVQVASLLAACIRGYEKGNQFLIEDGAGMGGPGGIILQGFYVSLQLVFFATMVFPPAKLSLACENVLAELMDMQREAYLDPTRKEEAAEISQLITYYERCSPVRFGQFSSTFDRPPTDLAVVLPQRYKVLVRIPKTESVVAFISLAVRLAQFS